MKNYTLISWKGTDEESKNKVFSIGKRNEVNCSECKSNSITSGIAERGKQWEASWGKKKKRKKKRKNPAYRAIEQRLPCFGVHSFSSSIRWELPSQKRVVAASDTLDPLSQAWTTQFEWKLKPRPVVLRCPSLADLFPLPEESAQLDSRRKRSSSVWNRARFDRTRWSRNFNYFASVDRPRNWDVRRGEVSLMST